MKFNLRSIIERPSNRALVVGFVVLALLFAGCTGGIEQAGEATTTAHQNTATVVFNSQTTNGTAVTVQSVYLPNGGYVAIHDVKKDENNPVGTVVGVSDYLKPGMHKNVPVGLFEAPGGNFTVERLQKSQTLSAVPHRETNGNRMFNFLATDSLKDGPYTKSGTVNGNGSIDARHGSIVVDTAYITTHGSLNGTANTTQSTSN
ncbi:MAG TPA: hypothetical protein VFJ06_04440 [Halococcus sp.]|nr:hypothetical protein [Halococcus sp.]